MKAYKIKAWIARDERNTDGKSLYIYQRMPKRLNEDLIGLGLWADGGEYMAIPNNIFPELTWEDEPKEVEVSIKAK